MSTSLASASTDPAANSTYFQQSNPNFASNPIQSIPNTITCHVSPGFASSKIASAANETYFQRLKPNVSYGTFSSIDTTTTNVTITTTKESNSLNLTTNNNGSAITMSNSSSTDSILLVLDSALKTKLNTLSSAVKSQSTNLLFKKNHLKKENETLKLNITENQALVSLLKAKLAKINNRELFKSKSFENEKIKNQIPPSISLPHLNLSTPTSSVTLPNLSGFVANSHPSNKIRNRLISDNEDTSENTKKIIVLNKKDEAKYNLE